MAERDFYNTNSHIAYPFVDAGPMLYNGGAGALPNELLVDAGFLLGVDSGYDPELHQVCLDRIVIGASSYFEFTSDAPALVGWVWRMPIDGSYARGCIDWEDTVLGGGGTASDPGRGFVVYGDLSYVLALAPGTYTLDAPKPRLEPATVQSLQSAFVSALSVADDPRRCPPNGCPCSSSSSAPSSSVPEPSNIAYLFAHGLIGDLRFKAGYNVQLSLDPGDNAIDIGAQIGAGEGPTCEDIIIDENGFCPNNNCVNCDGLIRSVNGCLAPDGIFRINGGSGVAVTPSPGAHRLDIRIDINKLCGSP